MNGNYTKLRNEIFSLNLSPDTTFSFNFQSTEEIKQNQPIDELINVESLYLQGINRLLTTIFTYLDKEVNTIFRSRLISKEQLIQLVGCFPSIYSLHVSLFNSYNEAYMSSSMVAKVLFDFLVNYDLLITYQNYVNRLPNSLIICKILESKSPEFFTDLKSIIISPVMEFSRLYVAVRKLYKCLTQCDSEKVYLYKAMSIIKSIIIRLESETRKSDIMNLKEKGLISKKTGTSKSKYKFISNTSVFILDTNFSFTKEVKKCPYNLILCGEEIILVPNVSKPSDSSSKTLSKYSIRDAQIRAYTISRFVKCGCVEGGVYCGQNISLLSERFNEIKSLYLMIDGSNEEDQLLRVYEELLQDFSVLTRAVEEVKLLNFSWKVINELTIKLSLRDLENKLSQHEQNLNDSMSSIVIFKSNSNTLICDRKLILFSSATESLEWKINFKREQLLLEQQTNLVWTYCQNGFNLSSFEDLKLPHILQPIPLKTNTIKNLESVVMTCKYVRIVFEKRFYCSLWICLANSWVIILYHDYKQWNLLDNFQLDTCQPIKVLCEVISLERKSPRVIIDSEIWIGSGNQVLIYSLLINRQSTLNGRLFHKSNVNSICMVDDKVWVGLNSNLIIVYKRNYGASYWVQEHEIPVTRITENSDVMTDIFWDKNEVFVISERMIFTIPDFSTPKILFQSAKKINALSLSEYGMWIAFDDDRLLHLCDRSCGIILQTISLPVTILDNLPTGMVTCIYSNERFIWVGTENGFIICIAAVDSSYCVSLDIGVCVSSTFSCESISMLIPFRNIEPISVEKHPEKSINIFCDSKPRSYSTVVEGLHHSNSCPNIYRPENEFKSERDYLCEECLKKAYEQSCNASSTYMLAIGTGISIFDNVKEKKDLKSTFKSTCEGQSTIFTFFE